MIKIRPSQPPRMIFSPSIYFLSMLSPLVHPHHMEPFPDPQLNTRGETARTPPNCFPALGFTVPITVPASLNNWWCAYDTEYAFMGFSYEVTECMFP